MEPSPGLTETTTPDNLKIIIVMVKERESMLTEPSKRDHSKIKNCMDRGHSNLLTATYT